MSAGTIVARTASGDVNVRAKRAPDGIDATTNSGDVMVLVPPGDERYDVDAETNSGDRIVEIAPGPGHTIRARTNSGDVVVDYGT